MLLSDEFQYKPLTANNKYLVPFEKSFLKQNRKID